MSLLTHRQTRQILHICYNVVVSMFILQPTVGEADPHWVLHDWSLEPDWVGDIYWQKVTIMFQYNL